MDKNTNDIRILTSRVVELESRLAFQDHTVEELNGVVIEQQNQLDRLESELALTRKQLEELMLELGDGAGGR